MARRNNRITIAAGPGWTDVFRSREAGGPDGIGARSLLISCASGSSFPAEYRVDSPADEPGGAALLEAGEAVRLEGVNQLIHHVVMRGVGGAAIGGVELLSL